MPVTENTSLLFSSCDLAIAILVNKIKRLAVFRVWKNTLFSEITSFIWPKWFCLLFSKIVDSKQSGPYLFKFPIEKCFFFLIQNRRIFAFEPDYSACRPPISLFKPCCIDKKQNKSLLFFMARFLWETFLLKVKFLAYIALPSWDKRRKKPKSRL